MTTILNLGSTHADDDAVVPSGGSLRRMVGNWPTLIAFYDGAQDRRWRWRLTRSAPRPSSSCVTAAARAL